MREFTLCETDADLEQFMFYMLEHRRSMHAAFGVKELFHFVHSVFQHGNAILARTPDGKIAGAAGYVVGTPESGFNHPEIMRIEMIHIREDCRCTGWFAKGLRYMAETVSARHPDVKAIEFYVSADRGDLPGLFGKFARLVETRETRFGKESRFTIRPEQLKRFAQRFHRREVSS